MDIIKTAIRYAGVSFVMIAVILVIGSSIPLPGINLDDAALQVRQFQVCNHGFFWWGQCWIRYDVHSHHDLASGAFGAAIIIFLAIWAWRRLTTHTMIKETED